MDLHSLNVFVEVVRQGGFSRAAKSVFLTQSAVSKIIKQLEDELGVVLVDRHSEHAAATAAGEIVYARALNMLAERSDILGELSELRGVQRGRLRLGLPPIGSDVLFAPLFAIYRSLYPGVDIELVEYGSRTLEDKVRSGEIDLGASLFPVPNEFEWQDVRLEPLDVLLREDHPLAGRDSIGLSELSDMPFILFDAGFALNPIILDGCARAGFTPTVAARSSQINFIVELVAAGLGVGFLPRMIADLRTRPGVRHITITDHAMDWHMVWIWRRGAFLPHAARAWLDLAQQSATT
jgi:DNA-binding transcriptional LysR family regulator